MTEREKEVLYERVFQKVKKEILLLENKKLNYANQIENINFEIAERLVNRSISKAKNLKSNITVSVVNRNGDLVLLKKMDGTMRGSDIISYKRAYISLLTDKEYLNIDLTAPVELKKTEMEDFVLAVGYPIKYDNKLIGAIGISGKNYKINEEIINYAINSVLESLI